MIIESGGAVQGTAGLSVRVTTSGVDEAGAQESHTTLE